MTTKKSKAPKKRKHVWVARPEGGSLCYCTSCGVYEDRMALTSQSIGGITMKNTKVFRPYKKPDTHFTGRGTPECVPIESGPADAPPPYVDQMMIALRKMAGMAAE